MVTFLLLVINVPTFLYTVLSKSCSDLKRLDPKAKSGISLIDPDGEGVLKPYHVTCDMSDKDGVGVTVIGHDSEDRTLVDGYSLHESDLSSVSKPFQSFLVLRAVHKVRVSRFNFS